jgi:hypothetical protein
MANPLYNSLVNKLRKTQYSQSTGTKLLSFGAIYLGSYTNFKNDRQPLIWIQWSDRQYTHGINLHYLNRSDRAWFTRMVYLLAKGNQKLTPKNMYRLLKMRRYNIVKTAYRKYFTSLLNMRLVSAGVTNLHSMVYTNHRESFIHRLNKQIQPQEISKGATQISYSSGELQDRITQSRNSYNITQRTSSESTRPASGSPVTRKAPWLKN